MGAKFCLLEGNIVWAEIGLGWSWKRGLETKLFRKNLISPTIWVRTVSRCLRAWCSIALCLQHWMTLCAVLSFLWFSEEHCSTKWYLHLLKDSSRTRRFCVVWNAHDFCHIFFFWSVAECQTRIYLCQGNNESVTVHGDRGIKNKIRNGSFSPLN